MEKRKLVRHIDGRELILRMPAKRFFTVVLPVWIILLIIGGLITSSINTKIDKINDEIRATYKIEREVNQDAKLELETKPTPVVWGVILLIGGTYTMLFMEIGQRQTNIDNLKALLKYKREGDIYFERSEMNVSIERKFIRNTTKQKREEKRQEAKAI